MDSINLGLAVLRILVEGFESQSRLPMSNPCDYVYVDREATETREKKLCLHGNRRDTVFWTPVFGGR